VATNDESARQDGNPAAVDTGGPSPFDQNLI
jgi:hypothetical protein